jgi:hypothetical protein
MECDISRWLDEVLRKASPDVTASDERRDLINQFILINQNGVLIRR